METEKLRVLVVDDTATYRHLVSRILAEIPSVEVVGTASNGRIALEKISLLNPELLILDIEMPELNGLQLLARIQAERREVGAIVLSVLADDRQMTIQALEQGAFDFIAKPQEGTAEENQKHLKEALVAKLQAFTRHRDIRRLLKKGHRDPGKQPTNPLPSGPTGAFQRAPPALRRPRLPSQVVAIGISTGGPAALAQLLPALPADLGVPLLIVQHMPPTFTRALAESLATKCSIQVKEAEDGEFVRPDTAFIAPGDRQMKVVPDIATGRRLIRITDDPPENSCRPSADYLFRSVAHCYGERATGVVMTGMGADGARGSKTMKEQGAFIIAQEKSTCVVYGMPREVVEAGIADVVAPLGEIAAAICTTVR